MSEGQRQGGCLTAVKPAVTDEEQTSEGIETGEILSSHTGHYLVLNFIGEGVFGKVLRCINLTTKKEVALKVFKSNETRNIEREIRMLEVVRLLNPVQKNVVNFFEKFKYRGQTCLAFEKLDKTIFQLMKERRQMPLSLSEIRPIAQQLLTAFAALRKIGVVHADLKPDNVMLVNHRKEPFRVKLIDFGLSFRRFEDKRGMTLMPLSGRAPEILLGLPVTVAIDMWSLGCFLAYLYRGKHLFRVNCEYQLITSIIELLGQPDDHLLHIGIYTEKFFKEKQDQDCSKWQLKTPKEYEQDSGNKLKEIALSVGILKRMLTPLPEKQGPTDTEDCRAFMSLLIQLLRIDPVRRITPKKALKHRFVTMAHLEDKRDASLYLTDARQKMMVCPKDDLKEELVPEKKAVKEPRAESAPVSSYSDAKGSPASCSSMPCSAEGTATAGVQDPAGLAEEEPAVDKDAATTIPAEETATGGLPDGGESVRVNKSCLKRIQMFVDRVTGTIFRKK